MTLMSYLDAVTMGDRALPVSVKLICVRRNQALVLRKRNGLWDLPGGKLEPDEQSLIEGLRREIHEELRLPLPPVVPVGHWIRQKPGRVSRYIAFFRMAGEAPFDLADLTLSDEHDKARWIGVPALGGLDMPDGFRDALVRTLTTS